MRFLALLMLATPTFSSDAVHTWTLDQIVKHSEIVAVVEGRTPAYHLVEITTGGAKPFTEHLWHLQVVEVLHNSSSIELPQNIAVVDAASERQLWRQVEAANGAPSKGMSHFRYENELRFDRYTKAEGMQFIVFLDPPGPATQAGPAYADWNDAFARAFRERSKTDIGRLSRVKRAIKRVY
jgi:hypothetical protein